MRWFKRMIGICTVMMLSSTLVFGAERINTLERKGLFGYESSGVAIRGYDSVAYFTESKAVEGLDAFSTDWSGATWKFASKDHLELFINDPEQYAPQYGGYCAYGVATDNLVKIEPDLWTIVDGKLFLNYDDNVQRQWEQDIPGFIATADEKFEKLVINQ